MPKIVKEIKDDILLNVAVNKTYYLMVKNLSLYLFSSIPEDKREETITNLKEKSYGEMDDTEKSFYTVALLISEIEKQAQDTDNIIEKEILIPGDEGFVMPKFNKD